MEKDKSKAWAVVRANSATFHSRGEWRVSRLNIHIFVVAEAIGLLYHGTIPDSGGKVSRVQDGREQGWPAP